MESISIVEKYHAIARRTAAAAVSAHRDPAEITIIVVTKGQPAEKMLPLLELGVRDFGENYPEETEQKLTAFDPTVGIRWHMIGHLQSRKSAIIARYFSMYHSVDRLDIMEKIQRHLEQEEKVLPVMAEVNISGEATKGGFEATERSDWALVAQQLKTITSYPRIQLTGLMCMPPLAQNPEDNLPYFAAARELRDYLRDEHGLAGLVNLSMGTREDFEAAVREGATHIRIGQAILGPRPFKEKL